MQLQLQSEETEETEEPRDAKKRKEKGVATLNGDLKRFQEHNILIVVNY